MEHTKTIEQIKRESTNILFRCCAALKTINFNREDASVEIYRMLVSQIAQATNELIIIANNLSDGENEL